MTRVSELTTTATRRLPCQEEAIVEELLVVVATWSMDLDIIFIIFDIRCTAMIKNE